MVNVTIHPDTCKHRMRDVATCAQYEHILLATYSVTVTRSQTIRRHELGKLALQRCVLDRRDMSLQISRCPYAARAASRAVLYSKSI